MKKIIKIYLDIDGTIIHEDLDHYNKPANHVREFLEALQDYDVYWLTTHCRDGDVSHTHSHLSRILSPELFTLVKHFKPTIWDTYKTEGIDLQSDFIWFDNDIFDQERKVLRVIGKENSIVQVDLRNNPNQLEEIVLNTLKIQ